MHIDALVAEIGSTTTLVSGFSGLGGDSPRFVGSGQAATTVLDGDVRIGLTKAKDDLMTMLGCNELSYGTMLATGSAAGGLRMSVHGLVHDMTVRAAEAAALGAGAIVIGTTSGLMDKYDIDDIIRSKPNLLLLAGGTDYGERRTVMENLKLIARAGIRAPLIYCGNIQNQAAVRDICDEYGIPLSLTDNVYPKIDDLNIEPVRVCIHAMFEKHIVTAPGMEHIREMVDGTILPTPGSVMLAAKLLYDMVGDVVVMDIGGATTDVHSVTNGSDEITQMQTSPEPFAKRTVEGDLGLYINAKNLVSRIGTEALDTELGIDTVKVMQDYKPVPDTPEQFKLTERLCLEAGLVAIDRHAGRLRHLYTPQGRTTIAEGKDLTTVKYLVGTGGALTRLPHREQILRRIADCNVKRTMLYPTPSTLELLYDNDYIMACLGALSKNYREDAMLLMKRSLCL